MGKDVQEPLHPAAAPRLTRTGEPQSSAEAYHRAWRSVAQIVGAAFVCLLLLEIALQVRSHVQTGQSIFNALSGGALYQTNPQTGLKLLSPNRTFKGSDAIIRTNSLGLRGDDVSPPGRPDEIRIALLGASSVMGAYARDNSVTMSELLRAELAPKLKPLRVEVINAGIAGATLIDQTMMLETVLAGLKPHIVVLYPGINDIGLYCKPAGPTQAKPKKVIELPKSLLTVHLVLLNTEVLRRRTTAKLAAVDPNTLSSARFNSDLQHLVDAARRHGIALTLVTNARAYRRDQPLEEQRRQAQTALHYNDCFDLDGLQTIYDRHNDIIAAAAVQNKLPLLKMPEHVPGGSRYFADANHFNEAGERLAAKALATHLLEQGLLEPGLKR